MQEPHPIASAFFASHDETIESRRSDNNCSAQQSTFVSNIRNSIGWRTRYASATMHPVQITPVECRTLQSDNSSPVKFH
eukprot:scaffold18835_cov67-Skeletonema_dohrnii-CCMP3373.AAC.3